MGECVIYYSVHIIRMYAVTGAGKPEHNGCVKRFFTHVPVGKLFALFRISRREFRLYLARHVDIVKSGAFAIFLQLNFYFFSFHS